MADESQDALGTLSRAERLVFGCARLHHLSTPARRERLLRGVLERGLTRFDVAPSYGNGLAERALGEALRGAGGRARVNTKVGLPARIYPAVADRVFPLARGLDTVLGTHRSAYLRRDFRPRSVRSSVEASLQRLRVERLDTVFLHEPLAPLGAGEWAAVREVLEELVRAGKARAWGLAGPAEKYGLAALAGPEGLVVQQPFGELERGVPGFVRERIAYGVYGAWKAEGGAVSFEGFVGRAAALHPEASFVVSTLDEGRVARWLGGTT